jgi:hypothetical protein
MESAGTAEYEDFLRVAAQLGLEDTSRELALELYQQL